MQRQNDSFEELKTELLERLEARGCTSITITGYRYQCNCIFAWLQENGYGSYSKEGGTAFLQDYYSKHGGNQYYDALKTVVYRLNDILDAAWNDVHSDKGKHFDLSAEWIKTVDRYCCWADETGHAPGTIKNKRYAISWFLSELSKLQCCSPDQLSPILITSASVKISDHNLWGEIRVFLRYLAEFEIVKLDYSTIIPHYNKPYVIPSVYSVEEIKRIEESVDTCTVLGKRDYAMILLASRMGMRSGDIVKLKIGDVKDRSELNIIQEKTGNILHLPLIKEVRSAIEDYLSVRPSSPIEQIFINVCAPYHAVTTSTRRKALKKYMGLAGIDPGNRKCGPHALRASLASSMVNDDISYETVRKVLGHSSNNAVKHYARIDVEKLRRYSLTPPAPAGRFHAFLYGEVK
ncbi:MAG: tyrosine-type recombinase/integrase [Lachnospiraceae bacterium]